MHIKTRAKASQRLLLLVWGSLFSNLTSDAFISNKAVKKTNQNKNETRARNQDIKMMILLYRYMQRKEKQIKDRTKQNKYTWCKMNLEDHKNGKLLLLLLKNVIWGRGKKQQKQTVNL